MYKETIATVYAQKVQPAVNGEHINRDNEKLLLKTTEV